MAWIFNGKHFGGYTFDHWFDEDDPNHRAEGKTGEKPPPRQKDPGGEESGNAELHNADEDN